MMQASQELSRGSYTLRGKFVRSTQEKMAEWREIISASIRQEV